MKKKPDLPPWGRSWAQDACSRAAIVSRRFLKEKSKWRTKPVSGEEGHSAILLAHTRFFTRLILILTGVHD